MSRKNREARLRPPAKNFGILPATQNIFEALFVGLALSLIIAISISYLQEQKEDTLTALIIPVAIVIIYARRFYLTLQNDENPYLKSKCLRYYQRHVHKFLRKKYNVKLKFTDIEHLGLYSELECNHYKEGYIRIVGTKHIADKALNPEIEFNPNQIRLLKPLNEHELQEMYHHGEHPEGPAIFPLEEEPRKPHTGRTTYHYNLQNPETSN